MILACTALYRQSLRSTVFVQNTDEYYIEQLRDRYQYIAIVMSHLDSFLGYDVSFRRHMI